MTKWKQGASVGSYAAPQKTVAVDAEWRRWIAENVLLGNGPESMLQAMLKAGVDGPAALAEIHAAVEHPYIAPRASWVSRAKAAPGSPQAKIEKRDWVLECTAAWRVSRPRMGMCRGLRSFRARYYWIAITRPTSPVVMTGAMDDWPAMTRVDERGAQAAASATGWSRSRPTGRRRRELRDRTQRKPQAARCLSAITST